MVKVKIKIKGKGKIDINIELLKYCSLVIPCSEGRGLGKAIALQYKLKRIIAAALQRYSADFVFNNSVSFASSFMDK